MRGRFIYRLAGFNPLPAIKPGDTYHHADMQPSRVVSIHSRLLSREILFRAVETDTKRHVSIHSRLLSREIRLSLPCSRVLVAFQSTPGY